MLRNRNVRFLRETGKAVPLDAFRTQKELKSLFFIAEQYLGKTLTRTDVDTITYFYETLHMSADLIEYLIETCVENGHKSMHYIQKVAFSWAEERHPDCFSGKGTVHALQPKLLYRPQRLRDQKTEARRRQNSTYIKKWAEEYGFSSEIIQEACRRTISATHQPSFEYADTILGRWHQNGVKHLADITALDEAFQKEKSAGRKLPDPGLP